MTKLFVVLVSQKLGLHAPKQSWIDGSMVKLRTPPKNWCRLSGDEQASWARIPVPHSPIQSSPRGHKPCLSGLLTHRLFIKILTKPSTQKQHWNSIHPSVLARDQRQKRRSKGHAIMKCKWTLHRSKSSRQVPLFTLHYCLRQTNRISKAIVEAC